MTTVVHCKKEEYDEYIGRSARRLHFGNPFTHQEGVTRAEVRVQTREEAISRFRS